MQMNQSRSFPRHLLYRLSQGSYTSGPVVPYPNHSRTRTETNKDSPRVP